MILCRLVGALSREGNSGGVAHLLHVSGNAHLAQLLVFLLLCAVCNDQTLFSIQKLVNRRRLLVLAFDRTAPTLDLAVAIGAHLGIRTGISELG